MSKDIKTPQAFPYSGEGDELNYSKGMTLRDYFAGKAMQTMISYRRTQFGTDNDDDMDWDEFFPIIAQEAYALADAMLKARKA